MLISTPTAHIVTTSDEPPYDINGNVIPLLGNAPVATPMFKSA